MIKDSVYRELKRVGYQSERLSDFLSSMDTFYGHVLRSQRHPDKAPQKPFKRKNIIKRALLKAFPVFYLKQ
jgi:hypothetical protein